MNKFIHYTESKKSPNSGFLLKFAIYFMQLHPKSNFWKYKYGAK